MILIKYSNGILKPNEEMQLEIVQSDLCIIHFRKENEPKPYWKMLLEKVQRDIRATEIVVRGIWVKNDRLVAGPGHLTITKDDIKFTADVLFFGATFSQTYTLPGDAVTKAAVFDDLKTQMRVWKIDA